MNTSERELLLSFRAPCSGAKESHIFKNIMRLLRHKFLRFAQDRPRNDNLKCIYKKLQGNYFSVTPAGGIILYPNCLKREKLSKISHPPLILL
jgi:hypothetical protein